MQRLLLALALLLSPSFAEEEAPYEVAPLPEWAEGAPLSGPVEAMLSDTESLPTETGDTAQVLLLENTWTLGEDGVPVTRYRMIYRVLVRDPGYWGQATASWRPWQEERPSLQARVISRDGREWTLDPRTISEVSDDTRSGAAASGESRLVAPLPGLGVGSVVEIVTERRQTAPPLPGLLGADYVFGLRSTRVAHERLVLDVPVDSPLRFTASGLEIEPSERREDGRRRISWTLDAQDKNGAPPELLPFEVNALKAVSWSSQASWAPGAASLHALVEASLEGADVAALAQELRAGAQGREATIDALLRGLRARVRPLYRNLTDDVLAPQTPADTLKRGTGDALDQATLLVALLRASGIEAEVGLLIGGGPGIDPEQPEPQRLDHALVRVPGEPVTWVEVLEAGFAPDVLPWWIEGRRVLMARAEGPALEQLPRSSSADNADHIELQYDLRGRLDASMRYREWGSGRANAAERAGLAGLGEQAWAERQPLWARYELGVEGEVRGGYQPTSTLSEPLVLEVEADASVFAHLEDETLSLRLPAAPQARVNALRQELGQHADEEREYDLQVAPERTEATVTLQLPPGFAEAELPEDVELRLGPLLYTRVVRVEGERLTARIVFDTGDGRLSPEQGREAVERLRRLNAEKNLSKFSLRSAAGEALAEGAHGEALIAARALAEAHPDAPVVALRHARLLSRLRLRDLAIAETERALALKPALFEAWVLLSKLRLQDRWGREGLGDWDLAGARAAADKAVALRPEDPHALGQVLRAYLTSPAGYYLGPGVPLETVAAQMDALREAWPEDEYFPLETAARALMLYTGRAAEVATLESSADGSVEAAVAVTEGPRAAVARIEEAPEAIRAKLAKNTAGVLITMRRYEEAAAIELALVEADDRDAWLLGAQRVEQLGRARSDEAKALRAALPALIRGEALPDTLLMSPEVRAAVEGDIARASAWSRVPPRALADALLSQAELSAEGKVREGRVLRVDLSPLGVEAPWIWLLQREGRALRVRAVTHAQRAVVAAEALEQGRPALARALVLPWAEARRASIPELPLKLRQRYEDLYALVDPARAEEPGWVEAVTGRVLEWEGLEAPRALALSEAALAAGMRDLELLRYRWYLAKDLGEQLEETGRAFAEALPEAKRLDKIKVLASSGLREEAEAAIAARWSNPQAPDALRARSWIAELDGDLETHVGALVDLAEAHEADDADLSVLAWATLFLPELPEDALEYAQRAQDMLGYPSYYLQRVEACVRLARGEGDEAWALLDKQLGRDREAPDEGWRMVQAGLAYSWGLPELAESLLAEVDENTAHFTRYGLAQRWLEAGTARMATPWEAAEED
ncbi:MAG: DUF3857 and transglutaminase domain-containing protein [Alphaproteobacteria bacterium]|nr:DUF3857 and transglutaminase domain-containing protein [Alphaproteobacteria bacterium]